MLRVDLTTGTIDEETPPPEVYRQLMGGKGMATRYLLMETPRGADPYSPESVLAFFPSVITGAPLPGLSRYTVAAKSPLTGGYGEAEVGGYLGPEIKFSGYDGIIIRGKAPRPCYLYLHDGRAGLRDARAMWGMTTGQTVAKIRDDTGEQHVRVACIGPAGERLVRFACVIGDMRHAAGRCGLGAVMGSKNLKAVAAKGSTPVEIKDPETLGGIRRWFMDNFLENPLTYSLNNLGTPGVTAGLNAAGILPTRNFKAGVFEHWEEIDGTTLAKRYLTGRNTCYGCPVACKRQVAASADGLVDPQYGGPEYETIAAFGSNIGVGDLELACKAHTFCNAQSLDSISTGMAIAFAMELFENGILTRADTSGLDLRFGNKEAAWTMLNMIAAREGLGGVLGEGVKRAAAAIGRGSEAFALHVKGLEIPMHEPRGKMNVGLGYATSESGADHMVALHDTMFGPNPKSSGLMSFAPVGVFPPLEPKSITPDKVRLFYYGEQWWSALKALSTCFFCIEPRGALPMDRYVEAVRAITGWNTSLFEIMKVGERATALARLFNTREGLGPADDTLPQRYFSPMSGGPLDGVAIPKEEFQAAVKMLYSMRGWDPETGRPTPGKLHELGIPWAGVL
jgi:aldehyde:ferredoxin oxidoreductase